MNAALHCPKVACIMTSSRLLWRTGFLKVEALSIYAVLRVLLSEGSLKLVAFIRIRFALALPLLCM